MSLIGNGSYIFVLIPIFFLHLTSSSEENPTISIDDFNKEVQEIRGYTLNIYKGISYSESSTIKNRYKELFAAKQSQGNTSNCPQKISETLHDDIWKLNGPIQEECLYLNIWQHGDKILPVIVWIHGGDFSHGSSTIKAFDAKMLAVRLGVIVVSIQYRLGALGFLYTGDELAPGNAGLKDQVRALEWIHDHIHIFGGDNQKITVIGQSAGSASLGYHLLSKKTSKLFQRAILLSGTPNSQVAFVPQKDARDRVLLLHSKLKSKLLLHEGIDKILSEKSWEEIVKAQEEILGEDVSIRRPFLPTIDSSLVVDHPINLMKKVDHLRGKEIIVSWTKDEGSLLLASQLNYDIHAYDKPPPKVNRKQFTDYLSVLAKQDQNLTDAIFKLYDNSDDDLLQSLVDVVGDYYFKCPANEFADELQKHGAKVYRMEYNHRSPEHHKWLGSAQGDDLQALFWFIKDYGVQTNYNKYISQFVHLGSKGIEDKGWKEGDTFIMGSNQGEGGGRRKKFCEQLKELVPGYNSRATIVLGNTATVLIMICHLIFII